MKIILRKKDSVTSIILFVFNIYGEYFGQHSISLSNLISFMQPFDKNETSTRMGLSRMVKAGILMNIKKNGQVFYRLTEYGLENINIWNDGISRFFGRYRKRNKGWDNNWYCLVLLDFNRSDKESQVVLDELNEIGLREVNKNIWISPYVISKEVRDLISINCIKCLEVVDGGLYLNFPLGELLENTFKVETVRERYLEFLNLMGEIGKETEDIKSNDGHYLPLLFRLGWNFYDIAVSDPVLPKELLESWEGDKVVEEFRLLRAKLFEKVTEYFNKLSKNG